MTIRAAGLGWAVFPLLMFGAELAVAASAEKQRLHVPSPDWRDQIIYFLMTDRFNDGDPSNNDQGAGEFDSASEGKYSGGDLKGIAQKLGYIQGLGATAIWITPPVANQWWDAKTKYSGYHGYWAENFMAVDKHLGTLADYKALSHNIHSRGMYLVQDIVVNHTGNFFYYNGDWNANDPTKNFALNPDQTGQSAPSQAPFNMNDVRNPAHRKAGIYHWTPDVSDYNDKNQEMNFQMSGLDDLNTENRVVRDALRKSYGYWIREVGVDAFRVDTAFYVPPELFSDFLYSTNKKNPGVMNAAKQTGRKQFHVFGEGFGIDKPFTDVNAAKIERYMTAPNGKPILPGMLNFPLYGAMGDVFARGRPTAELGYRIDSMMKLHRRPHLMATFVDNHDVNRFLADGGQAGLKQSLLMMMTLPGIPVIYYGTEQAFTEQRAAMFSAGYKSGGKDRFDTTAPLYQFIRQITALRKNDRVFSRGMPTILQDNAATPGLLAYKMEYANDTAFVVFNSADSETVLDKLATELAAGTVLRGVFAIDAAPQDVVVGAKGLVSLKLPARCGFVWRVAPNSQRENASNTAPVAGFERSITLNALPNKKVQGDFLLSGTTNKVANFKLVVDGDLSNAQTITADAQGRWQATVDTGKMMDENISHQLVAWSELSQPSTLVTPIVSATAHFKVSRQWTVLSDLADPVGDDVGPSGKTVYPTDPGWRNYRQADIHHVRASGAGGALKLDLTMNSITTFWNPQNGFDHVAFTIFIEIPGKEGGTTIMPMQNASLPNGMKWHYRIRAHGWSNALFSSLGASATNEGTSTAPAADIRVDQAKKAVSFILSSASLGQLKSLSGVKLYVATWDYDNGYRPLLAVAGAHTFGGAMGEARGTGGEAENNPLIMDDTAVITLP